MYLPNQANPASYQYYLFEGFRLFVSVVRLLPAILSNWLFVVLRVFFLSLLGFAAWVRTFSDTSFGTWFVIGIVACFFIHVYCGRPCFWPDERCEISKVTDQEASKWLRNELQSQKDICATLEHVRAALESKTRLEIEAESATERWKSQLLKSDQVTESLQRKIDELSKAKNNLEDKLIIKDKENHKIKQDFKEKLDKLNETVLDVKALEESKNRMEVILSSEHEAVQTLEKENDMLRATVEVMTKQRKELLSKYNASLSNIKELTKEKDTLASKLASNNYDRQSDMERIEDIQKLTRRLQSSITTAKGKLSKVGGVLGSDHGGSLYTKR